MVRSAPSEAVMVISRGGDAKEGVVPASSPGLSSPSLSPSTGLYSAVIGKFLPGKLIVALSRLSRICPMIDGTLTVSVPLMSSPAPRLASVPMTRLVTSNVAVTVICGGWGVGVSAVLS